MRAQTCDFFEFDTARSPFSKEVEDKALWVPPSKKAPVDAIVDTIGGHGHVLLTGEPGAGKTVLLRIVRDVLPESRFRLTYCHNATLGRRDFYRQLCHAIGLPTKATAASVFNALSSYVEGLAAEENHHPVFLLDECHLMRDDMLDHLHILQNYQWDSKALLSLVLIGLPELHQRLKLRRHRSLMSRIHTRIAIEPLVADDTGGYLEYRLARVGCDRSVFPPDAIAVLHEHTGGLLRDIDRIATLALDHAARRRTKTVHKDILLDAINIDMNGGLG
jgi:type II secretory pathway predicted ATPase ExeA